MRYQQATNSLPMDPPTKPDHSYLHTVTAGALLPLLQALVSSLAAGVLSLILLSTSRIRTMFTVSGVVMVIVFLVVWLLLQRHWLLLTTERLTGLDLNHDNIMGAPPEIFRIEVTDRSNPAAWHREIYDLPATPEQIVALATGVNSGTGFKEAYWTGSGSPFSQAGYRKLMAYLRQKGMIELVNEKSVNQGYKLTHAGKALFSRLASPPPPQSATN